VELILVTGANGFVGKSLVQRLLANSELFKVAAVARQDKLEWPKDVRVHLIDDINASTDWSEALQDVTTIIHLAARVHVMGEKLSDSIGKFRQVNVDGTLKLARDAAKAGVRRFIFASSIKVNGESTQLNQPYKADQEPKPVDPYGISKCEAELGLKTLSNEKGLEVVIIRSPLVYGPGVKANFLSMMNLVRYGVPLPFGGVTGNRRSFIFLDNLVDLIFTCISHPAAANQIFLASDDEDLSTAGLLGRMALALGRPSKLIAVPAVLITLGAKIIGKSDISQRLCGSLQADIKKTKDLLGWSPPVSVEEGLHRTAVSHLKT
jgi:nucleoside-diphosphate-sugar epimerase